MTAALPRKEALDFDDVFDDLIEESADPASPPATDPQQRRPVRLATAAYVAGAATLAVGWLLVGFFDGVPAQIAVLALSVVGVLVAAIAARFSSPVLRLVTPALPVLLLVLAATMNSPDGLGAAVRDAIGSGQLAQPPVSFGAGWQLVVGTLLISLGAAAVYLATAFGSTRIAALVPAPIAVGLTLIQPPGRELLAVLPALVLILVALSLAQGGELSRDGALSDGFELTRMVRTGALIGVAVLVIAVVALTTSVLPTNPAEVTAPPRAPEPAAVIQGDEPLLSMRAAAPVPLRVGVLDRYDGTQWLLPSQDPSAAIEVGDGTLRDSPPDEEVMAATITIERADTGRFAPLVPGTFRVEGLPPNTSASADNGSLRLPVAAERGLTYTLRFQFASTDRLEQVAAATVEPSFPSAPAAAQELLNRAPGALPERIQFLRGALFDVAQESEPAPPAPVTPARVEEILRGSPATPYELAATEALLVKWGGARTRIGYGYLERTTSPDGAYVIGADSGASWLEVQDEAGDWIALIDRPRGETAERPPHETERVLPDGRHIGQLFVPTHVPDPGFSQSIVRYWVQVYLICGVIALALWLGLPGLLRGLRRWRRRRWAQEHGRRAEVAVAYARVRDKAIDFGIGHPSMTPLEFLDALTPDPDHVELGWLVDRALYGDLRQGLTEQDVTAAQALSAHIAVRMAQGQSYLQRVASFASHASLRDPWSTQMPGAYSAFWRRVVPRRWTRWQAILAATTAAVLVLGVPALVGTNDVGVSDRATAVALPAVPPEVGQVQFEPVPQAAAEFEVRADRALIGDTALYVVQQDGAAVGTLQTAAFKSALRVPNSQLRGDVLIALGMTDAQRVGSEIFYTRRLGSLFVAVWFAPDGQSYQQLTTDASLSSPLLVFAQLVGLQGGLELADIERITVQPPQDARLWGYR
ncbi:MAG: hypothetical protein Q4G67_00765 [Actinomycetia bacterium]|nr:hypothetical protein [Actinomycetes bacterium]